MATPRNLHALENFKKGDKGSVKTHRVTRATDAGTPEGATIVTALQDVDAGMNGWFEDTEAAPEQSRTSR